MVGIDHLSMDGYRFLSQLPQSLSRLPFLRKPAWSSIACGDHLGAPVRTGEWQPEQRLLQLGQKGTSLKTCCLIAVYYFELQGQLLRDQELERTG